MIIDNWIFFTFGTVSRELQQNVVNDVYCKNRFNFSFLLRQLSRGTTVLLTGDNMRPL